MKKCKGLICVALSALLLLSCLGASAAETDTSAANAAFQQKYGLLKGLGIYQDVQDMQYPAETLTRERYASILGGFYGISLEDSENVGESESPYSDVPYDKWSAGSIFYLTRAGIMSGYTDGRFRPEFPITVAQAAKGLVLLLGYEAQAIYLGGYPEGYLNVASQLKLLPSGGGSYDRDLTCGEFTDMLYAMLHTEMQGVTSLTGNQLHYEIDGDTLALGHYFGIYIARGQFRINGNTALVGETPMKPGYLKVGNYTYLSENDFSDYLGMNVSLYYKWEDGADVGEAVYMMARETDNDVLTVSANDISGATTSTLRYYTESGKENKATLATDVSVIYNGRMKLLYSVEDLMPEIGQVKLIDADGDGRMETVIVDSYRSYWLSTASMTGTTLVLRDRLGKTPLEIDTAKDEIKIFANGALADLSVMKSDTVLLVASSPASGELNAYYKIIVSSQTVSGVLTQVGEDEIMVGKVLYPLSPDYDIKQSKAEPGQSGVFYLDAYGNVAGVSTETSANYAFLRAVDVEDGVSGALQLKLFTNEIASGTFRVVAAAQTLQIDGTYYKNNPDAALAALRLSATEYKNLTKFQMQNASGYEQLVQYRLDGDGNLSTLDTVVANKGYSTAAENGLHFDMLLEGSDSAKLNYFSNAQTIMGRLFFTNTLPFFNIPADVTDEKVYRIGGMGDYSGESIPATLAVFDSDDFFRANVIVTPVVGAASIPTDEKANLMVVERLVTTMNSDGETVTGVKGINLSTGADVTLTPEESSIIENAQLEPGDIVRWKQGTGSDVAIVERTVSPYDDDGTFLSSTSSRKHDGGGFYVYTRLTIGRALAQDGEILKLYYDASYLFPPSNSEYYKLSSVKRVLVFDRETGKLRTGSIMDIETDQDLGEGNGNLVFTCLNYDAIDYMVIYK